MEAEKKSVEDLYNEAMRRMRDAYAQHVRDIADDLAEQLRDDCGVCGDDAREWLDERLWEECDGDGWVIYTAKAQAVLLSSDNYGAYLDEFGSEGLTGDDAGMMWSRMAFAALRQDVLESLTYRLEIDPNDPKPEPEDEDA